MPKLSVKDKLKFRSKRSASLLKVRQERASANRAFKVKHGLSYAGAVKRPASATDEEGKDEEFTYKWSGVVSLQKPAPE